MPEIDLATPLPLALLAAVIVLAFGVSLLCDLSQHTDKRRGDAVALLLAVMLALPQWYQDRGENDWQRAELLHPAATAIADATSRRDERAFLIAQSWHETRFARYVLENRCSDGPAGARCDNGKARGPWQVHKHCEGAWDESLSPERRLVAGALCALKGYHAGKSRCGGIVGAFAAQHTWSARPDWCEQPWALRRVQTFEAIKNKL